jgi:hypothetical protein
MMGSLKSMPSFEFNVSLDISFVSIYNASSSKTFFLSLFLFSCFLFPGKEFGGTIARAMSVMDFLFVFFSELD